ncbi:GNAT family N-acetyltransferase [Marinibaculum pumilum]|uniref:GNAT family N-acetyltransferase n=1 Tax=Marinibaculum pumilum TaxID=1766165 RepID=A0ABV7L1N5_9PROT
MAATDGGTPAEILAAAGLRQAALEPGQFQAATALVAEAGWNQVADDWALMQRTGAAIGLVDEAGGLAATALALPYAEGARPEAAPFGWISMVLVAAAMRRRGLATHLLKDRIAWLQGRGLVPILDATEAGEQVYRPLGFGPGIRISRWQGHGSGSGDGAVAAGGDGIRQAVAADRPAMATMDREAFGADRRALIDAFLDRPGSHGFVAGEGSDMAGFAIVRRGRTAAQVGPLLAADEDRAIALLDAALATAQGPVFLDVLDVRARLVAQLQARGFTRQRGFLRMALGAMPRFGEQATDRGGRSMVIAGPEYG